MNNVLSLIIETKKKRIEIIRKNKEGFESLIKKAPAAISFKDAIKRSGKMSFIAEIKQASPSSGILRKDFSHVDIAKLYARNKVDAISVVTEEEFFLGKINNIEDIKKEVSNIPILRKDFILDEIQVLETRAVGADAILLIVRLLDEEKFDRLYNLSRELGLDVLVEVNTENELKKVLNYGVDIVGINNRNLNTLQIDLGRTEKLIPFIPADVVKVSESGISELKEILLLKGMNVDAVLVGSSLMKADNIEEKLVELHIDI